MLRYLSHLSESEILGNLEETPVLWPRAMQMDSFTSTFKGLAHPEVFVLLTWFLFQTRILCTEAPHRCPKEMDSYMYQTVSCLEHGELESRVVFAKNAPCAGRLWWQSMTMMIPITTLAATITIITTMPMMVVVAAFHTAVAWDLFLYIEDSHEWQAWTKSLGASYIAI